jgi:predicted nucleic acid-binding protein
MSGDGRPRAFLDASALYPSLLRNILMRLALHDLFRAYWSERVQNEWTRAVLRDRPHLSSSSIARTRRLMEENIEGANVEGYEPLIERVTLPDADDRHVLAAAIHGGANIIVTSNLRDFPGHALAAHGIAAQPPDTFILDLFAASPREVVSALRELRGDLVKPPMSPNEILAAMTRQALPGSANALRAYLSEL